ncbi:hypothetical protein HY523_02355 [Candidatus Berkelbacteria bacterium]|nr:hypothetical protein [Candidatus Berkelbacteria bacterium]
MRTKLAGSLPKFNPRTQTQIDTYMTALRRINDRRGSRRRSDVDRELAVLEFQLAHFLASRSERLDDLDSSEVQETIKLKNKLFPLGVPYLFLCLDGRVLAKLFAGLHGHSVRLPAGDSKEIVGNDTDGTPFMPDHSNIARTIYRTLDSLDRDTLVEVLDSHYHCAARKAEEEERYVTTLPDYGRYYDVVRKKQMGAAIIEAVRARYGETKRIIIIQTGFNPETGYLKMGLERDEVLADAEVKTVGFTDTVVERLIREGKIISTEQLVHDPAASDFRDTFSRYRFPINYQTDYRASTSRFWQAIQAMHQEGTLLVRLEEKIAAIFPQSAADEQRERALLLLANAFNGYLHEQYQSYPYGEHDESVVVGTYSDLGPYDRIRAFSANPDDPNFCAHVVFAQKLIRANRETPDSPDEPTRQYGRMSLLEAEVIPRLYPDRHGFARAPVWQIKFERYKTIPDDIEIIRTTNWGDLADINWRAMTDQEFGDYLETKLPNISRNSVETINRLRHRALRHYDLNQPTAPLLLEGQLTPLWILAGPDRRTLALLPFLTAGYSPAEFARQAMNLAP